MRQHIKTTLSALSLLALVGLMQPGWAGLKTNVQIVGVSEDLKQMGFIETWVQDGSGFPYCETRLYDRNRWEPVAVKTVHSQDDNIAKFYPECKALEDELKEKAGLQKIDWDLVELSPPPPSIKDAQGHLLSDPFDGGSRYPANQLYEFTLPNKVTWQIEVKSGTHPSTWDFANSENPLPKSKLPKYNVVFRPKLEPIAFDSIQSTYEEGQLLISPLKLLTNNNYGLITVMFRDVRQGFEGPDYHYHPYFIKWPDLQPMSVDEARSSLLKTSEYAMDPADGAKGDNAMHSAYRAYQRLKAERLPVNEIKAELEEATAAGKLYWLALLYDQSPADYRAEAQNLLREVPKTLEVIRLSGQDWQSQPLVDLVHQQAQTFKVPL
jgi:hypothetical protein